MLVLFTNRKWHTQHIAASSAIAELLCYNCSWRPVSGTIQHKNIEVTFRGCPWPSANGRAGGSFFMTLCTWSRCDKWQQASLDRSWSQTSADREAPKPNEFYDMQYYFDKLMTFTPQGHQDLTGIHWGSVLRLSRIPWYYFVSDKTGRYSVLLCCKVIIFCIFVTLGRQLLKNRPHIGWSSK